MNALLNAAWEADCDEPSDKLVLIYLADRANTAGKAWPHLPTIARQTGLNRRTVIRSIERLENRKHLTVQRKAGCSNRYLIQPISVAPARVTKSPATPRHHTSDTVSPVPGTRCHQHPNHQGTIRGTGRVAPNSKREGWQLLRDEKATKERLESEREACNPDKDLIKALKVQLSGIHTEIKGQMDPKKS